MTPQGIQLPQFPLPFSDGPTAHFPFSHFKSDDNTHEKLESTRSPYFTVKCSELSSTSFIGEPLGFYCPLSISIHPGLLHPTLHWDNSGESLSTIQCDSTGLPHANITLQNPADIVLLSIYGFHCPHTTVTPSGLQLSHFKPPTPHTLLCFSMAPIPKPSLWKAQGSH